jgi:competence protein ComEC
MTLTATFWDVQHGSATWLSMPNGENVLIDLGSGSFGAGEAFSPLEHMKRKCGVLKVDGLLITHQHYDHISDIENLAPLGLEPRVLLRPKLKEEFVREANIRRLAGNAVDTYEDLDGRYNAPVSESPFRANRPDGASIKCFHPRDSDPDDLNNRSIVAVVEYAGVKLLLPGDNEGPSWDELLAESAFCDAIAGTHVLLASHHGRENGYHAALFEHFDPLLTVISDGRFCDTSATGRYGAVTTGWTVGSRKTRQSEERKCLTTRNDGDIRISVGFGAERRGYLEASVE